MHIQVWEDNLKSIVGSFYFRGFSGARISLDVPTDFDTIEKALSGAKATEKGLK